MHAHRSKRLSPAFVVAMVALFVALGGTAGAVATQAATRAGQQASQFPGPASTAAGIVTMKSLAIGQLGPDQGRPVTISCDAGGEILGGGVFSDGPLFN